MASGTGISNGNPIPVDAKMGASTSFFDKTFPSNAYQGHLPNSMGGNTANYESNTIGSWKGGYIPNVNVKKYKRRKHKKLSKKYKYSSKSWSGGRKTKKRTKK